MPVNQVTHNKSFNCSVCKGQPFRTLTEYKALVSDRLVRDKLPVECASFSKQIVVTVSRVLTPHRGLGLNSAEIARTPDRREVGLAAGQA